MPARRSQTRTFLVGSLLNALGGGLTFPILVIYLHQVVGLPLATASLVLSWTALSGLATSPIVGTLVDRVGPKVVLLCGIAVKATAMLLWPTADSAIAAFAITTVAAIGDAAIWPPQNTLMARMVSPEQRQRFFGLQFMMLNLGLGIGGMVGSFILDVADRGNFTRLFVLDAASYALYFCFILALRGIGARLSDEERGTPHTGSYREVFADRRLRRLMAVAVLILTCGYASLDAGVPILLTTVGGLAVRELGPMWTVNTFVIVALQLVVLRLIDGRSRTRLMTVVCLLWATAWMIYLVGVVEPKATFVLACVAVAVFAVGETLWSPVGAALQNDIAPEHLRGRYNAMGAVTWVVAGAIGPAYSGIMLQLKLPTVWIATLVIGLAVAAWLAGGLRRELSPAQDGRRELLHTAGAQPPA
jgi:MFS family permease